MFDRRKGFRPQKKKNKVQPNTVETDQIGWDILRLNHDGRGVAIRKSGKTVFVSNALPGEQARLRIDKQHKRFDEATAVEILKASPQRIAPACQYADRCGGCQLQHLPYQAQLNYKETLLSEHLQHLAGIERVALEPYVAASEHALHYRRRARLSIPPPGQQAYLGFRARGSDDVIPIHDCKTLHPTLNALLPALQEAIQAMHGNRALGHVELLLNEQENAAHGSVIIRMLEPFTTEDSARWKAFSQSHSCDVIAQYNHGFQVIAATSNSPLELGYRVDNELLRYGPGEFIQVNAPVNEHMVAQALAWLSLTGTETVLELFAGFGNFSIPLAKRSAKVVAVEVAEQQVSRGSSNAHQSGCTNLKFIQADLSKPFTDYAFGKQRVDVMLLDPPRAGAADVVADLSYVQPERILYISCNGATFARDAAVIMEQGYELVKVSMLDMFPQTAHAESMALFIRNPSLA